MQILGRRLEDEKLFSVAQIVVEALEKYRQQRGRELGTQRVTARQNEFTVNIQNAIYEN